MNQDSSLFALDRVAQTIFDKKGINILALDVKGFSTLTDYFVIAEGQADKHVQALADAVIDTLRELGWKVIHVEGKESGDWIVLDFIDIIVHLFAPGMRERYQLEELWKEAHIVNVAIVVGSEK